LIRYLGRQFRLHHLMMYENRHHRHLQRHRRHHHGAKNCRRLRLPNVNYYR
jgi:hypothetical protein